MLVVIENVNAAVNNFVWGIPAIICIIGVGLYLSIRTGFIQIRKFPLAMKKTIGKVFEKKEATHGAMTPFQAVCTALAATVGTGNIVGVGHRLTVGTLVIVELELCPPLIPSGDKYDIRVALQGIFILLTYIVAV